MAEYDTQKSRNDEVGAALDQVANIEKMVVHLRDVELVLINEKRSKIDSALADINSKIANFADEYFGEL